MAVACRRPERLRFSYQAGDGTASERHVEPYRLVYTDRRWYLVAFDRDRDAWRTFRVDRMGDPHATGVPFDLRRAHPYSVFPELEFDIPTRTEGDCLARYLVRLEEVKQSLRIIDQCLNNMPDGPILAQLPRLLRPRPGRAYAGIEGPRGQYAAYVVSDGTSKPYRVHMRTPSFGNLQALPQMVHGTLIADVIASMGSMDFVLGDTDR